MAVCTQVHLDRYWIVWILDSVFPAYVAAFLSTESLIIVNTPVCTVVPFCFVEKHCNGN